LKLTASCSFSIAKQQVMQRNLEGCVCIGGTFMLPECEIRIVPLDWVKLDVGQVARHPAERVRRLAQDIDVRGLQHDPGVTHEGHVIYGNGRCLALKFLGRKEVQVKVYPQNLTDFEFAVIQLTNNLHCEDLTNVQKYDQITEIQRLKPDLKNSDLAKLLCVADSWITQMLSIEKCIPPVQEAFRAGLAITKVYEISKQPFEKQHELWAAIQSGMVSRETLRGKARRSRNGESKIKVSSAKIELSEGAVIIRRPNLDMYLLIESLEECSKAAKKEADTYDIKTFQKMMADRARKGGA
jgi:ParB-like chromosome segregation protein Spo0J